MKTIREIANQEECLGSADAVWWNVLPQDLQEEVLAWLPADSLPTYRRVCREWNALLSSSKFLSGLWVNAPINRKPWLILLPDSSRERCQAYCFYRGTWEPTFSLSFMSGDDDQVLSRRSAAGRLLVAMESSLYVCNPYSGTSIKLPPRTTTHIIATFLTISTANDDYNNRLDIYNVVVFGRRSGSNTKIVEIYDSSVKSWTIAGQIPVDLAISYPTIFCDGYFYCFCMHVWIPKILVFSIEGGGELRMCDISPMPDIPLSNVNNAFEIFSLVTCGSRLLVVLAHWNRLIIWESRRNSSNSSWLWEEIARMPPDIRERLPTVYGILCQGMGDCICFISIYGRTAIVCVYYLDSKLWKWLPSCELEVDYPYGVDCMAFQPRPDLKIT